MSQREAKPRVNTISLPLALPFNKIKHGIFVVHVVNWHETVSCIFYSSILLKLYEDRKLSWVQGRIMNIRHRVVGNGRLLTESERDWIY